MRKLSSMLVLGALALAASTSAASAAIVTYTTTGVFGGVGAFAIGPANVLTGTNGGTLTYTGENATLNTDLGSNINLGTFTSVASVLGENFSGATFTLTVNQVVPLPNGSQAFGSGTVSGTISTLGSTAVVHFSSPLSITIPSLPPITYSIVEADGGTPGRMVLQAVGNSTIEGSISAIPLPAAAWAGLSMLGGLGFFGAVRRRRMA